MNDLPVEIILDIARNVSHRDLHALTLVNRQFNTVTNPLLWQSVAISNEDQLMQLIQCRFLSHHDQLQYVRSLIIEFELTDVAFLLLIPRLPPSLDSLFFVDATHITDASFKYLPPQCPHLTNLGLRLASIGHESMVSVGQHCHQLRQLELCDCETLSPYLFAALSGCPLEDISMTGFVSGDIEDDDFEDNLKDDLKILTHDLVVGFPFLTSLTMDGFDAREYFAAVTAAATPTTLRHSAGHVDVHPPWPNLMRFRVDQIWYMDDDSAMAFIRMHPHLQDLTLPCNYHFSSDVLQVIADTLTGLIALDLSGSDQLTPHGVRRIIQQCPLLTFINLLGTNLRRTDFPELTQLTYHGSDFMHQLNERPVLDNTLRYIDGAAMEKIRYAPAHIYNNNNNNSNDGVDDTDNRDA
ncbi:hypothetical protein BCR42DRAFT_426438 [Absidia repens]|uniref:F-box domain-containing protein n=1 Tax=Absidia repens TaxID=90262 RepID=A0A1X2I1B7_9FUNG|nr:hypothetical protein BCR42DRAFT_426438 [Absidia repens]